MEANDYFIMAIVFAIVSVGLLISSTHVIGASLTADQLIFYGVSASLFVTSLSLTIGFIIAGIIKKIIKRKKE